jgi:hypothetical protein
VSVALTLKRLKEVLHYNLETGRFVWIAKTGKKVVVGNEAGYLRPDGRYMVSVDGKAYRTHRLAWFYVHGRWPKGQIDHINGDPFDNCIANLRDVTDGQNKQNLHKAKKHNKTGLLGVQPANKKFRARITVEGKVVYLGVFDTPEAAHQAYLAAKRVHHPFSIVDAA